MGMSVGAFGKRAPRRKLYASGYSRIETGIFAVGQDAAYLYGERESDGTIMRTADGETWESVGRTVPQIWGSGQRIIDIVFGAGYMYAQVSPVGADNWNLPNSPTGKVWRAPAGDFTVAWTDVTPPVMDMTVGRPSIMAHNGTYLYYGNYGYYFEPGTCDIFRSSNNGASWTRVFTTAVGAARHMHAVKVDPKTPSTIWATLGDGPGYPRGIYRSLDNGITWETTATNEYPIDIAFMGNGDIVGDGDGTFRPHVVVLKNQYRDGSGQLDSLVYPELTPADGSASWQGTCRGIFNMNEHVFYITTAENGAVGTRYGIWAYKFGVDNPVLLEELSGPWNFPLSRVGRTFRVKGYLFNTKSRIVIPRLSDVPF